MKKPADMSSRFLQNLSLESPGPGSDHGPKPVLLRELGATEENWTKATEQGSGIVVFGIALKRIVDTRLVSLATQEVRNQHPLTSTKIVVTAKDKLAFQIDVSEQPSVDVRPWPEAALCSDLSGILLLAGDSKSEGYALSQTLNRIVQEELNTPFTTRKDTSSAVKSATNVMELHVYYHGSKPETVIALRMFGGALDRPSAVIVIKTFFAALNAAVVGEETECTTTLESRLPAWADMILPAIEDLMPKQFLPRSIFKAVSMVGKALTCSILPFQQGFPTKTEKNFRTRVVSYSLGKQGTTSLLSAAEAGGAPYYALLAAAFVKASAKLYRENGRKNSNPEFALTCLLDARGLLPTPLPDSAVGTYSAGINLEKKVKENESLWDLAHSISSTYEDDFSKAKHFSHLTTMNTLFAQVMKRPSITPSSSLRTSAFALFAEPLVSDWEKTENLDLAGTYGPFSSFHGPGPCFCVGENLLRGPDLCLSLIYPEPVYSRSQMESIALAAIELLNTITSPTSLGVS